MEKLVVLRITNKMKTEKRNIILNFKYDDKIIGEIQITTDD